MEKVLEYSEVGQIEEQNIGSNGQDESEASRGSPGLLFIIIKPNPRISSLCSVLAAELGVSFFVRVLSKTLPLLTHPSLNPKQLQLTPPFTGIDHSFSFIC